MFGLEVKTLSESSYLSENRMKIPHLFLCINLHWRLTQRNYCKKKNLSPSNFWISPHWSNNMLTIIAINTFSFTNYITIVVASTIYNINCTYFFKQNMTPLFLLQHENEKVHRFFKYFFILILKKGHKFPKDMYRISLDKIHFIKLSFWTTTKTNNTYKNWQTKMSHLPHNLNYF